MLPYILQGLSYGFTAAGSPGPMQAFLLSQTLKNGWLKTLPAALAPLISDGPIIVLVLFILAQVPEAGLRLIRIAGGLFLLYLAWGAYKNFRQAATDRAEIEPDSSTQSLLKAALTNFLSPVPYIFWSTALGPILLEGWQESPSFGLAFLLSFYGMLIGGFALTILLFDLLGRFPPIIPKSLSLISAVILLYLGLAQLWQGVQ
ncbi:MAG: LysE family transporter [Candidatus Promineifilaceae bacterium]